MKNIIITVLLLLSCASNKPVPQQVQLTNSPENPFDILECQDSSGEIAKCVSDEDCCDHFVCGFDPEKSHIQKFCIQNR